MRDGHITGDPGIEAEDYVNHIPPSVKRHFVQNGLCLSCNIPVTEHRIIYDQDLDSRWTICWTEKWGGRGGGIWGKHFCVLAADHPDLMSRGKFEDLYG